MPGRGLHDKKKWSLEFKVWTNKPSILIAQLEPKLKEILSDGDWLENSRYEHYTQEERDK